MNREEKLVKNTIIYTVGNFVSKFLGFLLLPFYTHYISVSDYGYYDVVTATISLILPIITLQMTEGIYIFLLENDNESNQCKVISTAMSNIIKYLLLFNICYLLVLQYINIKYGYIILIQIDISIFSTVWMQICKGIRKNLIYSLAGIVFTFIMLASNIILIVFFKMGIDALILSNIFASIVSLLYIEFNIKIIKKIKLSYNNSTIKTSMLKYSIPLIPTGVGWWLMNVSDRFLLNYFKGANANGIYAIANKLPVIVVVFNGFFQSAWVESAVSEYKSHDKDIFYSEMFNRFMKFQLALTGVLITFNKFILKFLVDSKFYESWKYMPFLYLGALFAGFSAFYGVGYRCSKKTVGEFYTTVLGALVNVGLNLALIPVIGIQAASLSTMISYFITWLMRIVDTRKYFNIKINHRDFAVLMLLVIYYIYSYYYLNKYVMLINMLLSTVILVLYNINIIIHLCKGIKNKLSYN